MYVANPGTSAPRSDYHPRHNVLGARHSLRRMRAKRMAAFGMGFMIGTLIVAVAFGLLAWMFYLEPYQVMHGYGAAMQPTFIVALCQLLIMAVGFTIGGSLMRRTR